MARPEAAGSLEWLCSQDLIAHNQMRIQEFRLRAARKGQRVNRNDSQGMTSSSIGNAIAKACDEILAKRAAGANGAIEAYAENMPKGAPSDGIKKLYKGQPSFVGGAMGKEECASRSARSLSKSGSMR
jgi:hypothetical protein